MTIINLQRIKVNNCNVISNYFIEKKLIEVRDFEDILTKDFRIEISIVDLDLLGFYYRDKSEEKLMKYDGFLSRLSEKMSMFDPILPPDLNKNFSSMAVSDEEVSRILKILSIEVEESKIDFHDKIYSYNRDGLLTESQFTNVVKDLRINLSSSEVLVLTSKYYNSVDKKIYAMQLLEDLKKYKTPKDSSSKKVGKGSSKIIDKVSRHIIKNKQENKVIDEMYLMDRDSNGKLNFNEIKDAFHNAGVKLSTEQIKGVLEEKKQDSSGKYDYRDLLISMFSYSNQIKKNDEKLKKRSFKTKGDDAKRRLDYDSEEEKRKIKSRDERRDGRRSSVSSRGSNKSSRSNRSNRSNKPRDNRDDALRSRRGSSKSADPRSTSRSKSRRDSDASRSEGKDSYRSRSPHDSSNSRGDPSRSKSRDDRRNREDPRDRDFKTREDPRDREDSRYRDDIRDRDDPRYRDANKDSTKNVNLPKKSNLKKTEVTEITEFVGRKIKESKVNYEEVFKTASKNDPDQLITNGQLIDALKSMKIILDYNEKDRLLNEIDTQKIRNEVGLFKYEEFLKKAGVIERKEDMPFEVKNKLRKQEIQEAESIIREINKELRGVHLYKVVDIRTGDRDIPFAAFRNGLERNLGTFGMRLSNNKSKMSVLKIYLWGLSSTNIELSRLNVAFGIKDGESRRDDRSGLFEDEGTKNKT